MKLQMWCMHDTRSGLYNKPDLFRSDDLALITIKRSYQSLANNPDFQNSVSDFEFLKIGSFDDETGALVPVDKSDDKKVTFDVLESEVVINGSD